MLILETVDFLKDNSEWARFLEDLTKLINKHSEFVDNFIAAMVYFVKATSKLYRLSMISNVMSFTDIVLHEKQPTTNERIGSALTLIFLEMVVEASQFPINELAIVYDDLSKRIIELGNSLNPQDIQSRSNEDIDDIYHVFANYLDQYIPKSLDGIPTEKDDKEIVDHLVKSVMAQPQSQKM